MKITIVGAGHMGVALATRLVGAGHDVSIGFGHDPAAIADAASQSGATVSSDLPADVSSADAVLLCIPQTALDAAILVSGPLTGKTIVSVSSGLDLDPSGQTMGLPTERTQSVAETVAEKVPGARVVQAFTLTFAEMIIAGGGEGPVRPVLPVASDDHAAATLVAGLIGDIGFEGLLVGPLASARALETLATAFAQFAIVAKLAPMVGIRFVRAHAPGPGDRDRGGAG